jgi:hypothetical protein
VAAGPEGDVDRPGLAPVRPNPVGSGPAEIRWTMPRAADVEVAVYDVAGRRVAGLAYGMRAAGAPRVSWDRRDDRGSRAAAGVYLVRLTVDGVVRVRKVVVAE